MTSDPSVREAVSFEELLGWLANAGLVDSNQAEELFTIQPKVRAQLIRERLEQAGLTKGQESRVAASITAIDLFLASRPRTKAGERFGEDEITEFYAKRLGMPYVKLDPLKLDAEFATSAISKAFARKHNLLAIEDLGTAIRVATYNPFDQLALESVQQVVGKRLALVIASRSDIQKLITEFYGFRGSVKQAEATLREGVDISNLEQLVQLKSEREIEASDQHVVHAVEYLLNYALQQRASDIHIEPKREDSAVRFRIDGALHPVQNLPKLVHNAVVNRIKMLARLDIGEKRRPQDGRIKTEFDGKAVEIRVSTLAVAFGEKAVLRIFDPDIVTGDLTELGFSERELTLFSKMISQPNGIVLVTGPTGSGKTTTLYTALRTLATDAVNVTTIEDPIEMVFERVNQTAIQPAIGLGFAESLRTLLRQDPDVIMVGEVRDLETARHAIQAALTGHLVFSTLHTNDAPAAITRLLDLGAEHFLLASTLTGLVAQRLVRRVCPGCMVERKLDPEETRAIAKALPKTAPKPVMTPHGAGCVQCRHTGYQGRAAIFEMFEATPAIQRLIMDRADSHQVKAAARREGMVTLREAAVRRMLDGTTSFEEVISVTRED